MVDGEIIKNLLILAQGAPIDGPDNILGQAGPTRVRPAGAAAAAFLPAKGEMTFDTDDLEQMEARGTLDDVITHEMGHVIGIGTIWMLKSLLQGAQGSNPTFVGPNAMREYGALRGMGRAQPVPVEDSGAPGTRDSHWRDSVFGNELMTGFVGAAGNPLSRMTIASLVRPRLHREARCGRALQPTYSPGDGGSWYHGRAESRTWRHANSNSDPASRGQPRLRQG